MTDRATWLAGLSPGDEVAIISHGAPEIGVVTRLEAHGYIYVALEAGEFCLHPDSRLGGSRELREPTPGLRAEDSERRALLRRIEAVPWDTLPLATLRRVGACLEGGEE